MSGALGWQLPVPRRCGAGDGVGSASLSPTSFSDAQNCSCPPKVVMSLSSMVAALSLPGRVRLWVAATSLPKEV